MRRSATASDREPPAPAWGRAVRARLSSLRLSPTREAEIVDELSQHLDDHRRELIASGVPEDEATRLTVAELERGDRLTVYLASLRQARTSPPPTPGASTGHLVTDLWQDLRYAARSLARQPGFALAAVLTLALGIGANSAIFSVVHGVLLEALPFEDADRLYRLRMIYPDGSRYTTLSAPDFMSLREESRVFDRIEAYTAGAVTMLGGGEPREVRVVSISDGLFTLLGLPVVLGRGFAGDEHEPGRNRVAILDHGFWQRAFGGNDAVIGRRITVGGVSYAIVGVLGWGARLPADVPGARIPSEADLYLPIEYGEAYRTPTLAQRRANILAVLGKARQGVSDDLVVQDLRRIATALQAAYPQTNEGLGMDAIAARELIVGDVRTPLLVLLGAVGFVLLVACANVASLMLARASARQEELTVRAALGASRGRLLRQLTTEAVVLTAVGGAVGLALAYAGTQALVAAQPTDIPRLDEIRLDRTVVLFTVAIALLASLASGTLPALQATGQLARGLRAAGRGGGADRQSQRLRAALLVAEVALAVVLLIGAGLLLRSLDALTRVAPGFIAEQAMSFRIALYGRGYDVQGIRARVTGLEEELARLPGVTSVATTSVLPSSGPGPRRFFSVEDAPPLPADVNPEIGVVIVTPAYFRTIGARLALGRDFTHYDNDRAPPVAIINEAAVRRWFPEGNPIGRRVHLNGVHEVVGVVADLAQGNPRQPIASQLFIPYAQNSTRAVRIVLRTSGNPLTLASAIRAVVHRLDAQLAVSELTTLDQLQSNATARPRFYAALLALFAAVALGLAATGIFGVVHHSVAERTREIGIRMALGARAADVLRSIVLRTLALTLAGIALGLGAALALGRVIRNQLFGVALLDPPTLCVVALILLSSAAVASVLPARRAARLDPSTTLRQG